jgi:hypothetical protein
MTVIWIINVGIDAALHECMRLVKFVGNRKADLENSGKFSRLNIRLLEKFAEKDVIKSAGREGCVTLNDPRNIGWYSRWNVTEIEEALVSQVNWSYVEEMGWYHPECDEIPSLPHLAEFSNGWNPKGRSWFR